MKHFVIVYVSAVQSHSWRIWKLVFNVLFVAPCTRANIFVTEKLSQKICSCGCGFKNTKFPWGNYQAIVLRQKHYCLNKAEQLFVCFTCRNFGRSGCQMEKEKKNNCRPLAAERSAAAMFVLFVPSTRIFRAKVLYMVLGSLS